MEKDIIKAPLTECDNYESTLIEIQSLFFQFITSKHTLDEVEFNKKTNKFYELITKLKEFKYLDCPFKSGGCGVRPYALNIKSHIQKECNHVLCEECRIVNRFVYVGAC